MPVTPATRYYADRPPNGPLGPRLAPPNYEWSVKQENYEQIMLPPAEKLVFTAPGGAPLHHRPERQCYRCGKKVHRLNAFKKCQGCVASKWTLQGRVAFMVKCKRWKCRNVKACLSRNIAAEAAAFHPESLQCPSCRETTLHCC